MKIFSKKKNKRGFTLLETMLSVALLLIVTTMVYEGFMSTLQYAFNTQIHERAGDNAVSHVNSLLGNSSLSGYSSANDAIGLVYQSGSCSITFSEVIPVSRLMGNAAVTTLVSGDADYEEASLKSVTHRRGVAYCYYECPNCGKEVWYFERDDGTIGRFCNSCGYDEDLNPTP